MTVSVIIPTLNEADNLDRLIGKLARESCEIVIVDGGSKDDTVPVAEARGVHCIMSPPGRGLQLHAGAAVAAGDALLFLHADCRFPKGGIRRIASILETRPEAVGGNHRLIFDGADKFSRWLNGFYAWIRSHGVYYGDSGIFVRRSAFDAIGGIRPIALMEDFDLVRRMESFGETVCLGEPPLMTSSRRFAGRHPVAIVYGWLKIHALYYLGISPARLARIYDSERRRGHSPETACMKSVKETNSGPPAEKGGIG